jgi:hypothetical protein
VNKKVFATVSLYEAITLGVVEPLHGTLFHRTFDPSWWMKTKNTALASGQRVCEQRYATRMFFRLDSARKVGTGRDPWLKTPWTFIPGVC